MMIKVQFNSNVFHSSEIWNFSHNRNEFYLIRRKQIPQTHDYYYQITDLSMWFHFNDIFPSRKKSTIQKSIVANHCYQAIILDTLITFRQIRNYSTEKFPFDRVRINFDFIINAMQKPWRSFCGNVSIILCIWWYCYRNVNIFLHTFE